MTLSVSPATLRPADHRLVDVTVSLHTTDECGQGVTFALESVISNEPDDAPGGGDGHTVADIRGALIGTPDRTSRCAPSARARAPQTLHADLRRDGCGRQSHTRQRCGHRAPPALNWPPFVPRSSGRIDAASCDGQTRARSGRSVRSPAQPSAPPGDHASGSDRGRSLPAALLARRRHGLQGETGLHLLAAELGDPRLAWVRLPPADLTPSAPMRFQPGRVWWKPAPGMRP